MESPPMEHVRDSSKNLRLLSELLLNSRFSEASSNEASRSDQSIESRSDGLSERVSTLSHQELEELKALATTNHVILRSFAALQQLLEADGNHQGAEWIAAAMEAETARINHALGFLQQICSALEERGCPVTVIKSLDHWPDLGSDLDLYTDADAARVVEVMNACFGARLAARSWGDRLPNKWNFIVPGFPQLVEVHAGRL